MVFFYYFFTRYSSSAPNICVCDTYILSAFFVSSYHTILISDGAFESTSDGENIDCNTSIFRTWNVRICEPETCSGSHPRLWHLPENGLD